MKIGVWAKWAAHIEADVVWYMGISISEIHLENWWGSKYDAVKVSIFVRSVISEDWNICEVFIFIVVLFVHYNLHTSTVSTHAPVRSLSLSLTHTHTQVRV